MLIIDPSGGIPFNILGKRNRIAKKACWRRAVAFPQDPIHFPEGAAPQDSLPPHPTPPHLTILEGGSSLLMIDWDPS